MLFLSHDLKAQTENRNPKPNTWTQNLNPNPESKA